MFRLCALLNLLLPLYLNAQPLVTIYVSTAGNDRWSGALSDPRPDGTDGPLRTLDAALNRASERRATTPGAPLAIEIREGAYRIERGLRIGPDLSGTSALPTRLRAFNNEKVSLLGSTSVTNLRPIKDPHVSGRLGPSVRGAVVASVLSEIGITDVGTITPRSNPGLEVFQNGHRMRLSRWPNDGWLRIADVPQRGDTMFNVGLEREKRFDGVPAGRHYGKITYDGSRPSTWARHDGIYLHGYWTFDWSDTYQPVSSIDTSLHEIHLSSPHHNYGYTKNQRYYFANILEELDSPGEWYLDRGNRVLYFWPPASVDSFAVTVSMLKDPFFLLEGCDHVQIEGLTFAEGRAGAVVITGGTGITVSRCVMKNLGGEAVRVDGGLQNGIRDCEMYDLALGAISLRGGDRKTLSPARHFAVNNHIYDFSVWVRTGFYGCILDGVGHRLAHNEIHDAPFEAVYLRGNDHLVEYNEIHHVMKESGDAGALHTGRNWTWQGNIIRYNYFHELQGPGLHGVMGVYLDDWASGFTVFGNVFYRAGRATLIGGGRNNHVENNIYIECQPSVHVDARGLGWAGYYFDGSRSELFDLMREVNFDKPPYSVRYPALLKMYDGETSVPKYNVIARNISSGGRWMDVYDYQSFDIGVVTMQDNVIADEKILRRRADGERGWDPYYLDIDMQRGYTLIGRDSKEARSVFSGNRLVKSPPVFINTRTRRLVIEPKYVPRGFSPIPFEKMGLQ